MTVPVTATGTLLGTSLKRAVSVTMATVERLGKLQARQESAHVSSEGPSQGQEEKQDVQQNLDDPIL